MGVGTTSRGLKRRSGRRARRALQSTKQTIAKVPGPSNNPATNLLILDVAMRGASMIFGRGMEKALLRARYDPSKAADIVKGRSLVQSMAATGAARMATRSVPGFLLVTGGLLAKAVFDRSFSRHESVRRGERQLAEQAQNAPET
jgi:hypothetical protein